MGEPMKRAYGLTAFAAFSTLASMLLSADHRGQAGTAAGDDITVELELDTQSREVGLPADLAEALSTDPAARQFFDGLSPSQKKWHIQQAESAKTPETRQRRIAKSVELLHNQRARKLKTTPRVPASHAGLAYAGAQRPPRDRSGQSRPDDHGAAPSHQAITPFVAKCCCLLTAQDPSNPSGRAPVHRSRSPLAGCHQQ
jgi:Bacteriocin-protection, YdeI or OmpD-Associated